MRKKYILDTSSLIHDPCVYKQFDHCDVIIPIAVLNELDKLKKSSNEVGKNARVSIRMIDEISLLGDISIGVMLDNDICLSVDASWYNTALPAFDGFGDPNYGDTQILACAYTHWYDHPEKDVVLISSDINLRIKAKSRGIGAESRLDSKTTSLSDLYSGMQVIVDEDAGLDLQALGSIDPTIYGFNLYANECVAFEDFDNNVIAMARKISDTELRLIKKAYPWNLSARNKEQSFAIDLIMDKKIDLVTLIGRAGTGKSLIALATALELVISKKEYDKLIIYRPIQSVGNDIGFLPGDMSEKLAPWFQAIMDNFESLLSTKGRSDWKRTLELYQKNGVIEMEAITYIRGRSIGKAIILVDECQNLSKEEVKTILTRAGEGTKIILTGDIEQIDNSSLDATSNGLTHAIEKFKELNIAGHITFTHGERSRLASKAAEIL